MAGLKTKDEYGELATAVSITLAVLKKCKQNTWPELLVSMETTDPITVKALKIVDLSEYQLSLMGRFTPVLEMLSIKPPTVPAICSVCGLYVLTSDTAPSKCLVTAGCGGKPAKVSAATGSPDVAPEPEMSARQEAASEVSEVEDSIALPAPSSHHQLPIEDDPF